MIFLPIDSKKKEKKKDLPSPRKLDWRRVEARKVKGRSWKTKGPSLGKAKEQRSANAKGRKLNRRWNVKGWKLSSFGLSAMVGLLATVGLSATVSVLSTTAGILATMSALIGEG